MFFITQACIELSHEKKKSTHGLLFFLSFSLFTERGSVLYVVLHKSEAEHVEIDIEWTLFTFSTIQATNKKWLWHSSAEKYICVSGEKVF